MRYLATIVALAVVMAIHGCGDGESGIRDVHPPGTNDGTGDNHGDNDGTNDGTDQGGGDGTSVPVCGNGVVEEGEVCDDGNTESADGCNASCTLKDGIEFVPYHLTEGDQKEPWLAGDATGFALAWSDWSQGDGNGAAVMAAFFAADGSPIVSDVRVNDVVWEGNQYAPRVAACPETYMFVWVNEHTPAGASSELRGRVFSRDGIPVAQEFAVSDSTAAGTYDPSIAASGDRFLVVWAEPDAGALKARLFAQQGSPLPNPVDGAQTSYLLYPNGALRPVVVPSTQGGWWGAWQVDRNGSTVIEIGSITSDGSLVATGEVISGEPGTVASPTLREMHGVILVCWLETYYGSWGIRCKPMNPSLDSSYEPFWLINSYGFASFYHPRLLPLEGLTFLAVWEDWSGVDGQGASIVMRRFDLGGVPQGEPFVPEIYFLGHQTEPTATMTRDEIWISWTDLSHHEPDESGTAVRLRAVRPD